MEYIDGVQITDPKLEADERKVLARLVFQAVKCMPSLSSQESSLFQGNPPAGIILAVTCGASKAPEIALVDLTLTGRLSKVQRWRLVEIMNGIILGDD